MDGPPRGSDRHFSELIAQKQRLQQLESEYAMKIQKLKEAQALRNKGVPSDPPPELPVRAFTPLDPQSQLPPPTTSFPLPQPSLHDLTQDKLTLDSGDLPEADDYESEPVPSAATKGGRRQSSCSFTKPNLEQPSSTPTKDNSTAKPAKTSTSSKPPAEMFAGLDVDTLKLRYQQQAGLGEVLLRELHRVGQDLDDPPAAKVSCKTTACLVGSLSPQDILQ